MRQVVLQSLVILAFSISAGSPLSAQETVLEAPFDVSVAQFDYGGAQGSGVLRVSWSNPEMYDVVEFAVDGQIVDVIEPGDDDGADSVAAVEASTGSHEFAVRGVIGDAFVSPWTATTFDVLDESPVTEPITNVGCEYVPLQGGILRLSWALGSDAWSSGRLELSDSTLSVAIDSGQTDVEVLTVDSTSLLTSENLVVDGAVVIVFQNADGYASPPFVPSCVRLLPEFRRADCDGDSVVNITDSIFHLNHLFFQGGPRPRGPCDDACDSNDDGILDLADALTTLNYLFAGAGPTPAPGPVDCGVDPTDDFLGGICGCP